MLPVEFGSGQKGREQAADVTALTLSTNELTLPCKPGTIPAPDVSVSDSMIVDVAVTAVDPEDDVLTYSYTVSGGRIVGAGANVKWDLSGVYPGTYTITAGVDDGCGICGKTQTKTVTVSSCRPTTGDCDCATVEVAGPLDDVLKEGENVFTANVTPGTYDPTYEWNVEGGEITSGQGTPSISIKFDPQTLKSRKSVTVRIGGAPESCACLSEKTVEYFNGRRKL